MKGLAMILPVFLLTGCLQTAPVKRNFPGVPEEMMKVCPALKTLEPTTEKLSEVVKVVTDNYFEYHECKIKVDSWIEWYNSQKKIFDEVK